MFAEAFLLLLGAFLGVGGIDAIWDEIRYQVVRGAVGIQSLPFQYSVPWWWAGDLSMLAALVGIPLFMLTSIDVSRALKSEK